MAGSTTDFALGSSSSFPDSDRSCYLRCCCACRGFVAAFGWAADSACFTVKRRCLALPGARCQRVFAFLWDSSNSHWQHTATGSARRHCHPALRVRHSICYLCRNSNSHCTRTNAQVSSQIDSGLSSSTANAITRHSSRSSSNSYFAGSSWSTISALDSSYSFGAASHRC